MKFAAPSMAQQSAVFQQPATFFLKFRCFRFLLPLFLFLLLVACENGWNGDEGNGTEDAYSTSADDKTENDATDIAASLLHQPGSPVEGGGYDNAGESFDYLLFVSEECSEQSLEELAEFIRLRSGYVLTIYDRTALLAKVPAALVGEVMNHRGFVVLANAADSFSRMRVDHQCQRELDLVLSTWRDMAPRLTAGGSALSERLDAPPGEPLVNDALPPEGAITAVTGPMLGSVGVMLFTPESNGAIDPDTEDWTDEAWTNVYNEVSAGLTWWSDHASSYGKSVTYTLYHTERTDPILQTSYEPISHSKDERCLWINEIMSYFGYTDSSCKTNVHDYNTAMQFTYDKDNFASVFVVNSINDADGKFSDGYFAYAYSGGPCIVMTYDNGSYGINTMDAVTTHEFGHIFHACDEYYSPGYNICSCTCSSNPWHTYNDNCEDPDGCGLNEDCMMKSSQYPTTCIHTRAQIGWGFATTTSTTTTTTTVETTTSTTTTTFSGNDDTDDDSAHDDGVDDDGGIPPSLGPDDDDGGFGLQPQPAEKNETETLCSSCGG